MCKYCEKNKKLKSSNFCGSAELQILGNYLDIFGDEKKFNIFKRIYRPSFLINYCPMCRKKVEGGQVMTKKQETIERLNELANQNIVYGDSLGVSIEGFEELQEDIKAVLNMLKENSAEIQQKNTELAEKSAEIKKKDKIIDLMAEYISKIDIEEDVCIKNKTNPDWCNEDYTNCKNCIKHYFERKSEE